MTRTEAAIEKEITLCNRTLHRCAVSVIFVSRHPDSVVEQVTIVRRRTSDRIGMLINRKRHLT